MSDCVALLVTLECNYQPHLDFQRWLPCVGYVPARFMLLSLFFSCFRCLFLTHDLERHASAPALLVYNVAYRSTPLPSGSSTTAYRWPQNASHGFSSPVNPASTTAAYSASTPAGLSASNARDMPSLPRRTQSGWNDRTTSSVSHNRRIPPGNAASTCGSVSWPAGMSTPSSR